MTDDPYRAELSGWNASLQEQAKKHPSAAELIARLNDPLWHEGWPALRELLAEAATAIATAAMQRQALEKLCGEWEKLKSPDDGGYLGSAVATLNAAARDIRKILQSKPKGETPESVPRAQRETRTDAALSVANRSGSPRVHSDSRPAEGGTSGVIADRPGSQLAAESAGKP